MPLASLTASLLGVAVIAAGVGFGLFIAARKKRSAEQAAAISAAQPKPWGGETVENWEDGAAVPTYAPFRDYMQRYPELQRPIAGRRADASGIASFRAVVSGINNFSSLGPTPDYQAAPWVNEGDCADYAMRVRYELRRAGFDLGCIYQAHCEMPDGSWHAVVLVDTDLGTVGVSTAPNKGVIFALQELRRVGWKSWVREGQNSLGDWVLLAE